jgi:hypothetical protein
MRYEDQPKLFFHIAISADALTFERDPRYRRFLLQV